jgi:hypothetical protein
MSDEDKNRPATIADVERIVEASEHRLVEAVRGMTPEMKAVLDAAVIWREAWGTYQESLLRPAIDHAIDEYLKTAR